MQIHPGHGIFEGRKPALMDSFVQSLVAAPLFVFYEALFTLGFCAELKADVQKGVDKEIAAFKKQQKQK